MVRSMYSGVSGLRNHQLKMDVLSNNISNVNTYGYKASRATFADMFSQNLSTASRANDAGTIGGINPKQVGLGSVASTIDVIHSAGAFQTTDRTLDLTIVDEGFFPVTDGTDIWYTRAGNLYIDSFGFLIDAQGRYVMGMMFIDSDPFTNSDGLVSQDVLDKFDQMSTDELIKPDKTTEYDDIIDSFRTNEDYPLHGLRDEDGFTDARFGDIGYLAIPTYYRQISIDQNGLIKGVNEEGVAVEIGIIMTATFMNPSGLTKMGDNLYAESSNSGVPAFGFPGIGPNGSLKPGGLEMSNVDLAQEFTTMIVTQRGYQANSRIITVSDTMLEELVNLKR